VVRKMVEKQEEQKGSAGAPKQVVLKWCVVHGRIEQGKAHAPAPRITQPSARLVSKRMRDGWW